MRKRAAKLYTKKQQEDNSAAQQRQLALQAVCCPSLSRALSLARARSLSCARDPSVAISLTHSLYISHASRALSFCLAADIHPHTRTRVRACMLKSSVMR